MQTQRKRRGWAGWRLVSEDDKAKLKMKVTGTDGTEEGQGLDEVQTQIEWAAKAVNFSTKATRQNAEKKIPEEVTLRERAAAMRG